jgi:drug/metabolite transporter (DMT)-like permease
MASLGGDVTTIELPLDRRAVLLHGVGIILVASILFGVMAVCVDLASREMNSTQIAFVRFAGSLLVLLAAGRGRGLRPRAGNLRRVLVRGLLGAGAIVLYYRGIQGAGAGLATLVNCTYPVFTALFATTLMDEKFDARLGVALALNVVGVAIVLGPGAQIDAAAVSGGISALAAAVLAGGAVATARQLRISESALLITTYFMAMGALLTAPALLLGLPSLSPALLLALAGVVLTSVGGQVLLHQGLGVAPATQGSLAAATSVVTAAALQAVTLGEHLTPHSLFGACFVVAAVGLAVGRR